MCNSLLVSIVIPAYNAAETIIPCIESVLNQTYKHLEIIVIDDGSKDATKEIVKEYRKKYCIDNLQFIYQDNAGPSAARNRGIELAKGEYIAFLDSDDLWEPSKIEKQIRCFQRKDVALVGCRCRIGNNQVEKHRVSKGMVEVSFSQLLYHNYFNTPSVIIRARILKNMKFDINQMYSEDYRLWLLIAHSHKCVYLDEDLVELCNKPIFGSRGLSANLWRMEKGELSNYKHIYSLNYISSLKFICCSIWSLLKYVRRSFLSHIIL